MDGVYGRGAAFEDVVIRFERLVTEAGAEDGAEVLRFPPTMTREQLETSGYLKSFPRLAGTVHSFCGDDHDHVALLQKLDAKADWMEGQVATDIVLTPAACYPLYPMMAAQGALPPGGRLFDVQSYCFRREPSRDPARMQAFRQREYVRAGAPDEVQAFRMDWVERGGRLMGALQLPFEVVAANDAFFGRAGRLMRAHQRDQEMKLELVIPLATPHPTACMSFNYHQDHFAKAWGVQLADGGRAHTACVGFGLERIALALFHHHGLEPGGWPAGVRDLLWA